MLSEIARNPHLAFSAYTRPAGTRTPGFAVLARFLVALLAFLVLTASSCTSNSSPWAALPAYPGASELGTRTWPVSAAELAYWSQVSWRYYSSDAAWREVADYYRSELPARGWALASGSASPSSELEALNAYYPKLGLYQDMNFLEDWAFFQKDGDWLAVWVGLKTTEPEAGKTYITFDGESHNTFVAVLRTAKGAPCG